MVHYWYKVGRRYFHTDLCGFNDFVVITFHDGHTVKTHYGHDVAVKNGTIPRKGIKRFLSRCKLIGEYNSPGIPPDVLSAVYKDLPVPDFRKTQARTGEQFCLIF